MSLVGGPLTELSSGSLPGRLYGVFSRAAAAAPRDVDPLTELSSGSLPGQVYGVFSRAAVDQPRNVGELTELSSGSLPGRIYGIFARTAEPPEPQPEATPRNNMIAGRLIPEPLELLRRPRRFRYEGLVELVAIPCGRFTVNLVPWEYGWPGYVELVPEAEGIMSFESPLGLVIARAVRDDEEGFQIGLF